jgi:hypothetical protein
MDYKFLRLLMFLDFKFLPIKNENKTRFKR